MKHALAQVAFGLGANALVARDASQQCIKLKASGSVSGVLGQLGDGQNRIGGGYGETCYCLSNGGFTDTSGRGCILTPPTTQFQCDVGASPTSGFAIGSNGGVTYNGSGKFYACPVNNNGKYNVYSKPFPGQDKCVQISLSSAGSCGPSGAASSSKSAAPSSKPAPQSSPPPASKPAPSPSPPAQSCPAPTTITVTVTAPQPSMPAASKPAPQSSQHAASKPAPSRSASVAKPSASAKSSGSCPADLNGNYQYPHLIIPVDSSSPNTAAGTSYNGKVSSHTCSIFNFDIPQSYSNKTCSVVFLLPQQKDLETSSFTVSGNGQCSFTLLKSAADQKASWSNQPAKQSDLGSYNVSPGNSYTVATGPCAAGQTVSYEMCAGGDFSLEYFQDYNPSPIGLYVRQC